MKYTKNVILTRINNPMGAVCDRSPVPREGEQSWKLV